MRPPALRVTGEAYIGSKQIFTALNFDIAAASWTCLLGRSGSGKTTILKLIAGLDEHINFTGAVLSSDEAPLYGRIALMSQTDNLLPWLSVRGNVMLGSRVRGQANQNRAYSLQVLMARVGLQAQPK